MESVALPNLCRQLVSEFVNEFRVKPEDHKAGRKVAAADNG